MSKTPVDRTAEAHEFNELATRDGAAPVSGAASSLPPEPESEPTATATSTGDTVPTPALKTNAAAPHAESKTERPPGYIASCSLRGSGSAQDPEDAPIERQFKRPENDAAALARNTAPDVDVPHTEFDIGSLEPGKLADPWPRRRSAVHHPSHGSG